MLVMVNYSLTTMHKRFDLVYKTGTTPFFPVCYCAAGYTKNLADISGIAFAIADPIIIVIENGVANFFFPKSLAPIGKRVIERIVSDPRQWERIQDKERVLSRQLLRMIQTPVSRIVRHNALTVAGDAFLEKLLAMYAEYAYYTDVPGFLFQLYYTEDFRTQLQRVSELTAPEFDLLLSSHKKTNYEQFLAALQNAKTKRDKKKVAEKYYWLVHDYLGMIVDESYIIKQEHAHTDIADELSRTRKRIRDIKKIQQSLPKAARREAQTVSEMLYMYNERKKQVLSRVNIFIRRIVEARFPRLSFGDMHALYQFSPSEFVEILRSGFPVGWKERNASWVYEMRRGSINHGDRAYASFVARRNNNTSLKGTSASAGSVCGKVALILNASQINKFEPGSILVAPFTNINYLSIMRKAKAILTEVGGLTSHAAIISRELGVPSIVGIKDLLSSLNDGDRVDVNATKGTVKKI